MKITSNLMGEFSEIPMMPGNMSLPEGTYVLTDPEQIKIILTF